MREIKHLSIHQWLRSVILDSQQPTFPIGFLFLKLPPPPCAVLLVSTYNNHPNRAASEFSGRQLSCTAPAPLPLVKCSWSLLSWQESSLRAFWEERSFPPASPPALALQPLWAAELIADVASPAPGRHWRSRRNQWMPTDRCYLN